IDHEMISVLRRSPSRYIPLLISMCGCSMSDVPNDGRILILNRLWNAILENEFPLDINSFNCRLSAFIENEYEFDAWEMLNEAEVKLNLSADIETFNRLIERLSLDGNIGAIRAMIYEMGKHGVMLDCFVDSALVYCFALRGNYEKADALVKQSAEKYGVEILPLVYSANIRAAATRRDRDRLAKVLRTAIILRPAMRTTKERYALNIPYESVFETIWILSKSSIDGDGREHETICTQMLEHTIRRSGFFKYLYREVERHICHKRYYSAAMLLEEVKRVRDCLANQNRTLFLKQLMARFGNEMVVNEVSASKMKEVANRITTAFGQSVRFTDMLLYSTLTCRHMSAEKKFDYLSELIDMVDRRRERIHLILPLLACCESLADRLKMIFRCSSIGYKDISEIEIRMLSRLLLNPMFELYGKKLRSDGATLDRISKVLKSYSIAPEVIWRIVMNWWKLKRSSDIGYYVAADGLAMERWLKVQYEALFGQKKQASHYDSEVSLQKLLEFIDKQDAEKVHLFLKLHGFPEDTDFVQIVPRLLELYLENQDWPSLKSLLHMLSLSNRRGASLENHHLMQILQRHVADYGNIPSSVEFAYELRRLFPGAIFHKGNFYNSVICARNLFAACLEVEDLHVERIAQSMDLLRTLIKLDLFELQREETISDFFVRVVLSRLNWNEALNTWMKFQSSLDCSNAMVRLLKYAYRGKNHIGVQFVLHKAKTFMLESRVNAIHAATLVSLRRFEDAEQLFKQRLPSFEATCAFRLMNALNFRKPDGEFNINFSRMCLKYTDLANSDSNCEAFHSEWLKTCESQRLGEVALQLYALFKQYGQSLNPEQLQRVQLLVDQYDTFSRKWIYLPDGLLNVEKTEQFKEFERQKAELDKDVEQSQKRQLIVVQDEKAKEMTGITMTQGAL
uniref:ER lumen protein-retaining receptor n=4 Tax=Parascaris univalens TaxID=6257 RepID=A0A915BP57_PARUN